MTAQAIYDQATDQVTAGTSPDIDALRAKVQLQTREQQLIQARNNYAIQKLVLSRAIGLAPGQEFDLTDKSPSQPFTGITLDEALTRAYVSRADYQAAMANVRAAEFARKAAGAGYLPSLAFNADYGVAGADADVRTALLNLQSSADLVTVARSNMDLAKESLTQSRDRYRAGVTDTVEVVQAQEAVAGANEQYIASLYAFNLAKLSLARALGAAETGAREYFKGK